MAVYEFGVMNIQLEEMKKISEKLIVSINNEINF